MKNFRCCLLTLFAIFLIAFSHPQPALADIAPPKPPSGTNIEPGAENTQVRMLAETVILGVPSMSDHETGEALVTATFQMRNLGSTEERMNVRFPLCSLDFGSSTPSFAGRLFDFAPVENFSVWVDGVLTPVTQTYEEIEVSTTDHTRTSLISKPCWANFPVRFPPGRDVDIKVQYTQVGGYGEFDHGTVNFITIYYILSTGSGWKDTIGSADIIAHLPIEAENLSLHAEPQGAAISGKEVRWHFENFEPDLEHVELRGVSLTFLQPKYWWKIQQERVNTVKNPKDGEAWGRLGKAMKEAYSFEHGYYFREKYNESFQAYQKAIELLPGDADWHYGFADLVCWNALWPNRAEGDPDTFAQDQGLCLRELEQALQIKPGHPKTLELLQNLEYTGWVTFRDGQPVFLALTPDAPTPTPTPPPLPTAAVTRTIQPPPTFTAAVPPTATAILAQAVTTAPTIIAVTAYPAPRPPACGAILLPVSTGLFFLLIRRRH